MKNVINKSLLLFLLLLGTLYLTSCNKPKLVNYTINYELDGGNFEVSPPTEFDSNHIPTLPTPIKDGYEFSGWTYNGIAVTNLQDVLNINQKPTLKANWSKIITASLNATINKEYINVESEAVIYVDGHFDSSTLNIKYDKSIISIDEWLNVVGLKAGTTDIEISEIANPNVKTILTIEVINKNPILYSFSNRINVGNKLYFDIRNFDELYESSINDFELSVSDESIAKINDDFSITGLSVGSITLTATSIHDSRLTSSIVINVVDEDEAAVLKTENDKYVFKAGDIFSIDILGEQSKLEFVWGSNDLEVLRILENGDIIAVTSGSAAISVYEEGNPSNRTFHEFIVVENEGNIDYIGNLLSMAFSQNGYKEGPNNENKYGIWYKNPNQPWCAQFVSWCWYQTGLSNEIMLKYQGCWTGQQWCIEKGIFHYKEDYRPKPGDIIFFDGHTGICAYVEGDYMYTIEGNASNRVGVWRWALNNSRIIGYAAPEYPKYNGTVKDFSFLAGKDESGDYYWTNATGNQSTT